MLKESEQELPIGRMTLINKNVNEIWLRQRPDVVWDYNTECYWIKKYGKTATWLRLQGII